MTLPSGTTASRAKENTTMRQKIKSKWDKKCRYEVGTSEPLPRQFSLEGASFSSSLKTEGENWCRLIDEGVVVDNSFFSDEPIAYAVIRKGVLKKWYESLTDDFVGTIDKDHNRSIDLGQFTKDDLRLVELEDGRYAIDANVKLDQELYAVKDLLRMNNRTALSVEMFANADEYATAEKVTGDESQGKYLVPLIDDLKIEGYAVCLAPKSANSYKDGLLENAGATDINLTKEKEFSMKDKELKAPALEQVDASAGPDVEVTTEVAETEAVETPTEAVETEAVEATEVEPAEPAEEAEQEVKEEAVSEEEDKLSAIEAEIKNLKAENASLKEENADLKAQLTLKAEKAFATEERLTSILAMAASDAPTADEGGKTTPEEEKNKTEEVDAYTAAFAELNKEQ